MPNESERFATIYAQGHPIGFMITRAMGFEIFDLDEKPLAFVYSQREGIEILQRRDVGKWPSRCREEREMAAQCRAQEKAPTRGRG